MRDDNSVNPAPGYCVQYQLRRNEGERVFGLISCDARKERSETGLPFESKFRAATGAIQDTPCTSSYVVGLDAALGHFLHME